MNNYKILLIVFSILSTIPLLYFDYYTWTVLILQIMCFTPYLLEQTFTQLHKIVVESKKVDKWPVEEYERTVKSLSQRLHDIERWADIAKTKR